MKFVSYQFNVTRFFILIVVLLFTSLILRVQILNVMPGQSSRLERGSDLFQLSLSSTLHLIATKETLSTIYIKFLR